MSTEPDTEKKERLFLSPPHMGGDELRYVREAFDSNFIAPVGPQINAFEEEFCAYTGFKHAVALTSGTAAMHLALRFIGVGPGDEVFASTLTFIGSVSPVTFLGATPVFIDCDRETWNMDPVLLGAELGKSAAAGKLPKAVIPTDLYGQCADYTRIRAVCEPYGVPVVVDAAEAMGARYYTKVQGSEFRVQSSELAEQSVAFPAKAGFSTRSGRWVHAGVGARAAVFSFNGNKIITTSGGGMLASDDRALIEKARFWSQQAKDPFAHYEHTEIGYNYRMSNVLAAIGRGQLQCLEDRVARKREICEQYRAALGDEPGIVFMPEAAYGKSNRWLTVVLIDASRFGADAEAVRIALEAENIESRPVWKPMHKQPVFSICRVVGGTVSESLFEEGLCLPSGTAMTGEDIDRVAEIIRRVGKR